MRLKQFEAFWSIGNNRDHKHYKSDFEEKAKEKRNEEIITTLLNSSGNNYTKVEVQSDKGGSKIFKVSLKDEFFNRIKSISDKIDGIEVQLINITTEDGYGLFLKIYLKGNDYKSCSSSGANFHASLNVSSSNFIQIDKYFNQSLNKDNLDSSIDTFLDKETRVIITELLEESNKRLKRHKRTEYIQSNIDEITSCFYELIDISNTYKVFPNQANGVTLMFEIDDINSRDATFQINDKMSIVLNILLEAKGRLNDIIEDCDIKITVDNPIQITIS